MKLSENEADVVEASNTQLIQSLLILIPHTVSFKGKWSVIGRKLSYLKSLISDLSDFPSTALSFDILRSLSLTLSQALSLSQICHNPNLPGGKLKTQNDVDSISAKIDTHINDFQVLLKSGVLHDGVVSVNSKREPIIRVESRNLITRLQIGSTESRNSALDSLLGLFQDDDYNRETRLWTRCLTRKLDLNSPLSIIDRGLLIELQKRVTWYTKYLIW